MIELLDDIAKELRSIGAQARSRDLVEGSKLYGKLREQAERVDIVASRLREKLG